MLLLVHPTLRPAMPLAAPAVAPPVMLLKDPQWSNGGPLGTEAPGVADLTGRIVPSKGASLQQKVEMLCAQLQLAKGQSVAETIDKAVQAIGMPAADVEALNLMQKADACLEQIGVSVAADANDEPTARMPAAEYPAAQYPAVEYPAAQSPIAPRPRGPPPIGYGQSYESHMFGDDGYGYYGGMPIRRDGSVRGYGFFGPHGGNWGGWGGWGGYGRYSPWEVAYSSGGNYRGGGGYNYDVVPGYDMGTWGGHGSWGPNAGYGGLRRGSAAERALGRSAGELPTEAPERPDSARGYGGQAGGRPSAAPSLLQVQVPRDKGPGDSFTVDVKEARGFPWGGRFEVTVPEGVRAGMTISVELPTRAAAPQAPEPQWMAPAPQAQAPAPQAPTPQAPAPISEEDGAPPGADSKKRVENRVRDLIAAATGQRAPTEMSAPELAAAAQATEAAAMEAAAKLREEELATEMAAMEAAAKLREEEYRKLDQAAVAARQAAQASAQQAQADAAKAREAQSAAVYTAARAGIAPSPNYDDPYAPIGRARGSYVEESRAAKARPRVVATGKAPVQRGLTDAGRADDRYANSAMPPPSGQTRGSAKPAKAAKAIGLGPRVSTTDASSSSDSSSKRAHDKWWQGL